MNLAIDFHCHIYPVYDLRKSLLFALGRFSHPSAIFLTERQDCAFFDTFFNLSSQNTENFSLKNVDQDCFQLNEKLFILRGRQYATKEGIEVLSLFAAPSLKDKLSAEEYCTAIVETGGIIAFSWAFGKWRGDRGKLIEHLSQKFGKDQVVILDSRLRPSLLPLPKELQRLSELGFSTFVGSDPLPLKSHEDKLGSFANVFEHEGSIDSEAIRRIILKNPVKKTSGSRSSIVEFVRDQVSLRMR